MTVRAADSSLPITDVFVGGQEGYPTYRIPALAVSKQGTLLAIAEGRVTKDDQARNHLVLKRSPDHGKSWLPLQVIAREGASSLNNPTVVVVRETGRILLVFQRYPEGAREFTVVPGFSGTNVTTCHLIYSDDDGLTWSSPRDLTAQVKRPTVATSLASGPGNGIQLQRGPHTGRILIPFNQGPPKQWQVYAAWSDDRGNTWKHGELAPNAGKGQANEVQMVELAEGSVLLNARNQGGDRVRKTGVSRDGGATWSALLDDPNLPEPVCQASFIRHPNGNKPASDVLLFSNPLSQSARTNGVIRLSRDEGKTWPISRALYHGSFAYSSLATLPDDSIGCLFERDDYSRISFSRFTLDWILGKQP